VAKKECPLLKDLLAPGLKIVFCGTATGKVSAARGEYYAGPGNKFWPVLFEVSLTPRRLAPGEYQDLLGFGIGLTDVVKGQAGGDASIDFGRSNPDGLKQKIEHFSPLVLAFNGKKAAQVFLGERRVELGLQAKQVGKTRLFVAPSTSGAANGYWNVDVWYELAEMVIGAAT
jgi:double-stranded uracil-DNA glycosylase